MKIYIKGKGSRLKLTNNEIKDIIKVIRSLENKGIFFKGTTNKIINQERGFLNFPRPLMKNVLTLLAKIVLLPLGLTVAASTTDVVIQKKILGPGLR